VRGEPQAPCFASRYASTNFSGGSGASAPSIPRPISSSRRCSSTCSTISRACSGDPAVDVRDQAAAHAEVLLRRVDPPRAVDDGLVRDAARGVQRRLKEHLAVLGGCELDTVLERLVGGAREVLLVDQRGGDEREDLPGTRRSSRSRRASRRRRSAARCRACARGRRRWRRGRCPRSDSAAAWVSRGRRRVSARIPKAAALSLRGTVRAHRATSARKHDIALPTDDVESSTTTTPIYEFLKIFALVSSTLIDQEDFARTAYESLEDGVKLGNLKYREMFFTRRCTLRAAVPYKTVVDGLVTDPPAEKDFGVPAPDRRTFYRQDRRTGTEMVEPGARAPSRPDLIGLGMDGAEAPDPPRSSSTRTGSPKRAAAAPAHACEARRRGTSGVPRVLGIRADRPRLPRARRRRSRPALLDED